MIIKRKCPKCGSQFGLFLSFILARAFPAKCSVCGEACYRKHRLSYYTALSLMSVGLFGLIFIAMASGFVVAMYAAISYVAITALMYVTELWVFPVEVYTSEMVRTDKRRGFTKAIMAILIIVVSVIAYFVQR